MAWTMKYHSPFEVRWDFYEINAPESLERLLQTALTYVRTLQDEETDPYDPNIPHKSVVVNGILEIFDPIGIDLKNPDPNDRIYFFPDKENQVLHWLLIGNRETRNEDVRTCQIMTQNLHG